MTLEYAYEDWCLAQLAKPLGRADDYQWLLRRAGNYTNLWDAGFKSMRPRNADGSWLADFAPVGKAGSFAGKGFCEADAAIYTHFVPQDVPGLIRLFGGNEAYVAGLIISLSRPRRCALWCSTVSTAAPGCITTMSLPWPWRICSILRVPRG